MFATWPCVIVFFFPHSLLYSQTVRSLSQLRLLHEVSPLTSLKSFDDNLTVRVSAKLTWSVIQSRDQGCLLNGVGLNTD